MKIVLQKHNQQQGIALVIVMLVIMTLSTLAAGFALSMKVELRLAAQANFDQQMQWMAIGGAEFARFVMTEQDKLPGPKVHSLNQLWAGGSGSDVTNGPLAGISLKNIDLGDGQISLEITDLERKFNINSIPFKQGLLQQAMLVMGVDASSSPVISDAISDWIDPDDNARSSGAENQYYLGLDPPYYCKNGMVDEMTELLLVKGVTPDIFWGTGSSNITISPYQARDNTSPSQRNRQPTYVCGLNDLFSCLSSGKINVNTAPLNTLRMVFDGDENIAQAVIAERDKGGNGQDGATQGSPFTSVGDLTARVPAISHDAQRLNTLCDFRSSTFEVLIDVVVGDLSRHYVATITRAGNGYVVTTLHEK